METPAILRQRDGPIVVVYSDRIVIVATDGSIRTQPAPGATTSASSS